MNFNFSSLFCNCPRNIESTLNGLTTLLGQIIMKLDGLKQALDNTKAQLLKASSEIQTKIENLEIELQNQDTTPEVDTALEELKAVAQQLDDIVPDAVVE